MSTTQGWLAWKVRQLQRLVHAACGGDQTLLATLSSPFTPPQAA